MKHNWEYKKINDLGIIKSGYTPSSDDLATNGDFPYFKVAEMNLPGNEKYLIHAPSYLSGEIKTFPANSIVFPKNGAAVSTNKKRILQVDSVVDLNTAVMLANQNISVNYLYYILINIDFANLVKRGAVPTLNISELKNIIVPVPPMETQEQIVAELDQIHDLIAKNRELLSQLDALTKSLFYDIFGDPSVNPKSFPLCALSDICDAISIGITYKPEMVAEDGTIVLRSSNIQESKFVLDDIVRVQMQLKESQYVKKNDILMCSRNGSARLVGKVCLIPDLNEKMSWGAFMTIIRSKHFRFLFHYFRLPAFREQLKKTKTSTVNQITIGMLKSIKLPFPPLALQEDFAAKVEAIEAQKAKVEAEIAELQTLLDARMDYWFN